MGGGAAGGPGASRGGPTPRNSPTSGSPAPPGAGSVVSGAGSARGTARTTSGRGFGAAALAIAGMSARAAGSDAGLTSARRDKLTSPLDHMSTAQLMTLLSTSRKATARGSMFSGGGGGGGGGAGSGRGERSGDGVREIASRMSLQAGAMGDAAGGGRGGIAALATRSGRTTLQPLPARVTPAVHPSPALDLSAIGAGAGGPIPPPGGGGVPATSAPSEGMRALPLTTASRRMDEHDAIATPEISSAAAAHRAEQARRGSKGLPAAPAPSTSLDVTAPAGPPPATGAPRPVAAGGLASASIPSSVTATPASLGAPVMPPAGGSAGESKASVVHPRRPGGVAVGGEVAVVVAGGSGQARGGAAPTLSDAHVGGDGDASGGDPPPPLSSPLSSGSTRTGARRASASRHSIRRLSSQGRRMSLRAMERAEEGMRTIAQAVASEDVILTWRVEGGVFGDEGMVAGRPDRHMPPSLRAIHRPARRHPGSSVHGSSHPKLAGGGGGGGGLDDGDGADGHVGMDGAATLAAGLDDEVPPPVLDEPSYMVSAHASVFCELYLLPAAELRMLLELYPDEDLTMQLVAQMRRQRVVDCDEYDDEELLETVPQTREELMQRWLDAEDAVAAGEPVDVAALGSVTAAGAAVQRGGGGASDGHEGGDTPALTPQKSGGEDELPPGSVTDLRRITSNQYDDLMMSRRIAADPAAHPPSVGPGPGGAAGPAEGGGGVPRSPPATARSLAPPLMMSLLPAGAAHRGTSPGGDRPVGAAEGVVVVVGANATGGGGTA
jgi:hypothetical protein